MVSTWVWLSKVEDESDGKEGLLEFCFLRKEMKVGIPMGSPAAPAEV